MKKELDQDVAKMLLTKIAELQCQIINLQGQVNMLTARVG